MTTLSRTEEVRHGYGAFSEIFDAVSVDAHHQFSGDILHAPEPAKRAANNKPFAGWIRLVSNGVA
jgi:hypothetical protein